MKQGISGIIAGAFIKSKLSILLMIAFLLMGAFSIYLIPSEEEPQIEVPMADIMIGYPGASPKEIENSVSAPLEKIISNIKGVEDVYSTSMDGMAMLTVQFYVGEDVERSFVKLYNELMKNMDRMPQGATMPLVKSRAIDDVPVLAFTLWSDSIGSYQLRQLAEVVGNEIKKVPDVAHIDIIGGNPRQVSIRLDKERMAASRIDMNAITQTLQANNMQLQSGNIISGNRSFSTQVGGFFSNVDEIKNIIVGTNNNQPVYLHQVALVEDGPKETDNYLSFGYGAGHAEKQKANPGEHLGVTISIAKKKGSDAMKLAKVITGKMEHLKKDLITDNVHVEVTRNYGETAAHKVSELLLHLSLAIVIVTLFVMLAMGWRGGLVVFLSVPITFALTLFAYYFTGYTLNRITLFALVFVTGIVTDDSIIIAENMHRHFKHNKLPPLQAAIYAINEVGNPTILATLTVIAAVLPMAFVSGMMGPYMSPMPIGASIAMTFSLVLALTLTPYFGFLFLRYKDKRKADKGDTNGEDRNNSLEQGRIYRIYNAITMPFLESRVKRWAFMLGLTVVLIATVSMFFTKAVSVKMLPFDNKNEVQVIIDMPEGTTLERTNAVAQELAMQIAGNEMVTDYQIYSGTASPISFNGLVRHYDMRRGDNVADIQVNLLDKSERNIQSHDIAKAMRPQLQATGRRYGANVKVVEVPPGPPVMSTIVAEIYGPDYNTQTDIARQVMSILRNTDNVVDVDWMMEDDQKEFRFTVDKDKAMKLGIAEAQVAQVIRSALSGNQIGVLHQPDVVSQVGITLKLSEADKASVEDVLSTSIVNSRGQAVPVSSLVTVSETTKEKSISRKNQKRVVYVTAEVAGSLESPVYPILDISDKLKGIKLPAGYHINEEFKQQPELEDDYSLKWDGEWKITYEVFRDLGLAFLFVIIIIYMLLVGWFQSFLTPLVQLTVIPLSLIGIALGHYALGAYFTATSMIGFIALAGIMVRNSILLIDFIDIRLKENIPLKQAIIEAGAIRTTPIILTAGAVLLGAIVILFDPIFQGLAIALIGGTLTSTVLTLLVVPLLYYKMLKNKVK